MLACGPVPSSLPSPRARAPPPSCLPSRRISPMNARAFPGSSGGTRWAAEFAKNSQLRQHTVSPKPKPSLISSNGMHPSTFFFCSFGFRFVHIIQGSRPCHHSCVRALPAGVKLCANTRSQRHAPVMLAGARHRYVATARHSVHDDCQRACGRSASRRPQGEAAREVAGNERAVVGRWHVMAMTWPTHHGDLTSSWARAGESRPQGAGCARSEAR